MYKRILLKLSGEALKEGSKESILNPVRVNQIAEAIKCLVSKNIQVAIVVGAGNIWRGAFAEQLGFDRVSADYMGMLGTIVNAVTLSSSLKTIGVESVVFSPISSIEGVVNDYNPVEVDKVLNENKVAFLAGGTGKPYFTTDTAATLRAIENNCDAIFVAKNGVDGLYDSDPNKNPQAKFIKEITYKEILELNLQVMDLSAIELLLDKDIEIRIFSMSDFSNFEKIARGEDVGSVCKKGN